MANPLNNQKQSQPAGPSKAVAATVTIGTISAQDVKAIFVDPNPGETSCIADYEIINYYVFDSHIQQRGITSPKGFQGKTCALTQSANPTAKLIIEWSATQEGSAPKAPEFDVDDDNLVLILNEQNPAMIEGTADGVDRYSISGRYTYACLNADDVNIAYPVPPFISQNKVDSTVDDDAFTAAVNAGADSDAVAKMINEALGL